MTQSGKAAWSVVTALAVAVSLASLVPASGSPSPFGCCLPDSGGCTDGVTSCANGNFTADQVCGDDNARCREPLAGCCDNDAACVDDMSELFCANVGGRFVLGGTCDRADPATTAGFGPDGRCVAPNGGACLDPIDCESGNCVGDTCCDTSCGGAFEACNVPGQEGTCTTIAAAAPATSHLTLIVALLALFGVGVLSLRFASRKRSGQLGGGNT